MKRSAAQEAPTAKRAKGAALEAVLGVRSGEEWAVGMQRLYERVPEGMRGEVEEMAKAVMAAMPAVSKGEKRRTGKVGKGKAVLCVERIGMQSPRLTVAMHVSDNALHLQQGEKWTCNIPFEAIIAMAHVQLPSSNHSLLVLRVQPVQAPSGKSTLDHLAFKLPKGKKTTVMDQGTSKAMGGEELAQRIAKLVNIEVLQQLDPKQAIACSHKTRQGHLVLLGSNLLFAPSPLMYIEGKAIHRVTKACAHGRYFDVDLELEDGTKVNFGMISEAAESKLDSLGMKVDPDEATEESEEEEEEDEEYTQGSETSSEEDSEDSEGGEGDEDEEEEEDEDEEAPGSGSDEVSPVRSVISNTAFEALPGSELGSEEDSDVTQSD